MGLLQCPRNTPLSLCRHTELACGAAKGGAETSSHFWARCSRCQEELLTCSLPSSRALCRQCGSRSTSMESIVTVLHPAPRHCSCTGSLILTEEQLLDSSFLRNPTCLQSIASLQSWIPSYLILVWSQHPGSPLPSKMCHMMWELWVRDPQAF